MDQTYEADGLNVLFEVWLVARATVQTLDRVLRPSGLNAEDFAVYSMLSAPGGATPTELARWMAAIPSW